jgi:hypothetical protein
MLWPMLAHHIFWADHITTRKATGHTPFFMTHGAKPLLPFDITEVTFLLPKITAQISSKDLLAIQACQLAK